jgi:hypothetical protein
MADARRAASRPRTAQKISFVVFHAIDPIVQHAFPRYGRVMSVNLYISGVYFSMAVSAACYRVWVGVQTPVRPLVYSVKIKKLIDAAIAKLTLSVHPFLDGL